MIKNPVIVKKTNTYGFSPLKIEQTTLTFKAAKGDFINDIEGNGQIKVDAKSHVNYTGDGSQFKGQTNVAGFLAVNNILLGSLEIEDGGRLQGSGTVGNTVVKKGATLAPGNSIGTLRVKGDLIFTAGSIYEAEIDPAGNSDLTEATGDIVIENNANLSVIGTGLQKDYLVGTTYTLLKAGNTLTGNFSNRTTNLPLVDMEVSKGKDGKTLDLKIVRNNTSFEALAKTAATKRVAKIIENLGTSSALYNVIATSATDDPAMAAESAYTTIKSSGQIYASSQSFLLDNGYYIREAATARLRNRAEKAIDEQVSAWGQGHGIWGDYKGSDVSKLKFRQSGFVLGSDSTVEGWRMGVLGAYGKAKLRIDDVHSSSDVDSYHLGVYGGTLVEGLNVRLGGSYTWNKSKTTRNSELFGQSYSNSSDVRSTAMQFFGEVSYPIVMDENVVIEPTVSLAHSRLKNNGFNESGSVVTALKRNSTEQNVTFSTVGVQTKKAFTVNQTEGLFEAGLGWRHAFGAVHPTANLLFVDPEAINGNVLSVNGTPIIKNAAVINLGVKVKVAKEATIGVNYSGVTGSGNQKNSFLANFVWNF